MKYKSKCILSIVKTLVGTCVHEITVRRINKGYNCRVFVNGVLNQEYCVYSKTDIGKACRDMLRTEDKCGNISAHADAARSRINKSVNNP